MTISDEELSDIFGSDDCTVLCGGLCDPPCLADHHTGSEIIHCQVAFSVCSNALSAFEVHMHREDRYLSCMVCLKPKEQCFCGVQTAVFQVKEGYEAQKARGRIRLEVDEVSVVFGTEGNPVPGQEDVARFPKEIGAETQAPASGTGGGGSVETWEIDDVFGLRDDRGSEQQSGDAQADTQSEEGTA